MTNTATRGRTCRAEKPTGVPGLSPWCCGRPEGHTGLHVAYGIGNVVLRRWRRKQ